MGGVKKSEGKKINCGKTRGHDRLIDDLTHLMWQYSEATLLQDVSTSKPYEPRHIPIFQTTNAECERSERSYYRAVARLCPPIIMPHFSKVHLKSSNSQLTFICSLNRTGNQLWAVPLSCTNPYQSIYVSSRQSTKRGHVKNIFERDHSILWRFHLRPVHPRSSDAGHPRAYRRSAKRLPEKPNGTNDSPQVCV